jgi:hypothetical protein
LIKNIRRKSRVTIVYRCANRKVVFKAVLVENPDVVIQGREKSRAVLVSLES